MKANEFVKKHGLVKAIDVVKNKPPMNSSRYRARDNKYSATISTGESVSTIDLKRLVESHELVEWHGGLKYAKSYFERNSKEYPNAKGWDKLAEAIADVESCMEVSSGSN